MKKSNLVFWTIFIVLLGIIFRNWFLSYYIIGGDWPFFFQNYLNHFNYLPPIWNSAEGNGLGGQSIIYATDSYLYFTGWFFSVLLHIPWVIVYKIVWFGLFIVLSTFSSFYLFKNIFPKNLVWQRLLASFIYTTNTYILLVVGGGQMGVALSYAISPLVLSKFIKVIEYIGLTSENLKSQISNLKTISQILKLSTITGLLFAVQVMFDFRFAYITLFATIVYLLVNFRYQAQRFTLFFIFKLILFVFVIPLGITGLLHAFWLLPILAAKSNPVASLGSAYTSLSSVKYFSFANFENALGLFHPYWPENIFGKVGFMKPEYLIFPIIAFASLFFIKNAKSEMGNKKYILYFALIGLIGIFLAKGANDPFGSIYLWMFDHVPGFILFRDPMKWYELIVISYSVLIPFVIYSICEWFIHKKKFSIYNFQFTINSTIFNFQNIFVLVFIIFWLFTIRQAVFGQLSGTFAQHEVPNDYVKLKNMLLNDSHFGRTLWLPKLQRFGYYDQNHPPVEGSMILGATTSAEMVKVLMQKNAEQKLEDSDIKYIIVPYDSEKELFLKDRKYNDKERQSIISQLQTIHWLTRDSEFKNLLVYIIKNGKDRFWMSGSRKVSYQKISDTEYTLTVSPGSSENLIFDESYNPSWIAVIKNNELTHNQFGLFNSYTIPSNKKAVQINLKYSTTKYFISGRIVSLITLISLFAFLFYFRNRKIDR